MTDSDVLRLEWKRVYANLCIYLNILPTIVHISINHFFFKNTAKKIVT